MSKSKILEVQAEVKVLESVIEGFQADLKYYGKHYFDSSKHREITDKISIIEGKIQNKQIYISLMDGQLPLWS